MSIDISELMSEARHKVEIGMTAKLIKAMAARGATEDELDRAIKHFAAAVRGKNCERSRQKNDIRELEDKYQPEIYAFRKEHDETA